MTDYKKYINALRKCAKEHENDRTFTGHIIVSDLCRDTANLLEELEQEPNYSEIPTGSMDYISKQEVVGLMMHIWGENFSGDDAMQESIDAIRELPSVTPQEPQSFKWCTDCKEYDQEKHCCHRYSKVIRNTVAEIKQEPRKGHWHRQTNDYVDYYECSECGMAMGLYDVKNYCPNCGSRNEVEK